MYQIKVVTAQTRAAFEAAVNDWLAESKVTVISITPLPVSAGWGVIVLYKV